jgi:hypothetical protein
METAEVESVLRDYGKEIQQSVSDVFVDPHHIVFLTSTQQGSGNSNGALLMAVVGAKLSEGLNFTDNLARAVVMVGLPYPNASSPEMKERLKYVSNLSKQKGEKEDAGKELYENLCMNAVNQSIGTRLSIERALTYPLHREAAPLGTRKTGQVWFWSTLGIHHPGSNASYPAGFFLVQRLPTRLGRL